MNKLKYKNYESSFLIMKNLLYILILFAGLTSWTCSDPEKNSENVNQDSNLKIKILLQPTYNWISTPSDNRLLVIENGKAGFVDLNGNIIVPFQYDGADNFSNSYALVVNNQKYGFIDLLGNITIPFTYDHAYSYISDFAVVKKIDKYGVINKQNQVIISFTYDKLKGSPYKPFLLGCKNNLGYIIDYADSIILTVRPEICSTDYSINFNEIDYSTHRAYLLANNDLLYSTDFLFVKRTNNEFFIVQRQIDRKYALLDNFGKQISDYIYDKIVDANENLFRVKINNKYGFIDLLGNIVIPIEYDYADSFYNGLANIAIGGLYGFIDTSNNIKITPEYDSPAFFKYNYTGIKKGSKYCIINEANEIIRSCIYENLWLLNDTLFYTTAQIQNLDGTFQYPITVFRINGQELISNVESLRNFDEYEYLVVWNSSIANSVGIIDYYGKLLFAQKYEWIYPISNELFIFTVNNKYGLIDILGNVQLPPDYNFIQQMRDDKRFIYISVGEGLEQKNGLAIIK